MKREIAGAKRRERVRLNGKAKGRQARGVEWAVTKGTKGGGEKIEGTAQETKKENRVSRGGSNRKTSEEIAKNFSNDKESFFLGNEERDIASIWF